MVPWHHCLCCMSWGQPIVLHTSEIVFRRELLLVQPATNLGAAAVLSLSCATVNEDVNVQNDALEIHVGDRRSTCHARCSPPA